MFTSNTCTDSSTLLHLSTPTLEGIIVTGDAWHGIVASPCDSCDLQKPTDTIPLPDMKLSKTIQRNQIW